MLEKNQKKLRAKKFREQWSCARPQGSVTPNKKRKNRSAQKAQDRKESEE